MDFTLCLTHACNLRCGYCYAGEKRAEAMSWETARRAVDFCLDHTMQSARPGNAQPSAQVGFFGGEPMLEWDLLRRAHDYAASESDRRGIALKKTVTTNMTLLDEPKARWLRENGFWVGLSLDGNAAMHDSLRRTAGGEGSHERCARALDFFTGPEGNGEVIMVVDPRNVRHMADSVAWLIARDIRHIALNPNFSADWPDDALSAWREAYDETAAQYTETYRRSAPVRINVMDGKIRARIKGGYAACDKCGFGKNEVAISARGNLYPCERSVGEDADESVRIGNVFSGFDAARRQALVSLRGNIVGECADCPLRARCMNWCSCINLATTGAINRVAGTVCFHEKISIAAADRAAASLYAEANPVFLAKFYSEDFC